MGLAMESDQMSQITLEGGLEPHSSENSSPLLSLLPHGGMFKRLQWQGKTMTVMP